MGRQPLDAPNGDPPVEVQAIRTAVERPNRFVQTGFRRHGADGFRGHIRRVDREHPHAATQRGRKGCEQVPLMDLAAQGFQVPPCTPNGPWFDVRSMKFHPRHLVHDCRSHGPGSAAEVHHDRRRQLGSVRQQGQGLVDQQLGPAARHKDAGFDHNAATGELRPSQDVLQGNPLHPALNVPGKFRGSGSLSKQERGFLLGENTTCRPQKRDDPVEVQRRGLAVSIP